MTASLTSRDRAVLMALMTLGEEVPNPVLKERLGLSLEGDGRRRLNDLKFVVSTRRGRSFSHELTDDGWAWCWEEMTQPVPSRSDSGTRGLYAVLAGLRRYMEKADLRLSDVFGLPPAETPLADRIFAAYAELAAEPGSLVSLAPVRARLKDVAHADVDAALVALQREPGVSIVPQTDQRLLTPQDRAAAVRIGGKDKHLLKVQAP